MHGDNGVAHRHHSRHHRKLQNAHSEQFRQAFNTTAVTICHLATRFGRNGDIEHSRDGIGLVSAPAKPPATFDWPSARLDKYLLMVAPSSDNDDIKTALVSAGK